MTTNNNKAKGILRSKPRYSAENNTTSSSTPTTANCSDGPATTSSSVVRSLADLVRSSAELSAEAAGITNADVGRVISHHGVPSNAAVRPEKNNDTLMCNNNIQEQEEKIIMEGIPLLQISESGSPYLKFGGAAAAAAAADVSSNNGPAVVDANGDIAFGIVGEDGEHVRFCELNDDNGKENDEHISSRERIQHRINMYDAGDEDDEEHTNECNISDSESDATGDDAILAELGMSELIPSEHDSDYDEEPEEQPISKQSMNSEEMRAFLIIWQTLSRWVTPVTIELLQGQDTEEKSTPEPQSSTATEESPSNETTERRSVEIGASRRSGIMSMIRMYITRSMAELKRMPNQTQQMKDTLNDQRMVEQRLADLVRTFDVNGPVANFNTKQWKIMTTILIVISFPSLETDSITLPASAQSLGMTTDEYRYLTRSALNSLSNAV